MEWIPAYCKDEALAVQIRAAKEAGTPDAFDVWWLGQSGFLIQWNGQCLLFDPYLSDSLTRKYANTDKPHVRMSERVIDPAMLDMIDIVTSSHNHTDHLDAETLRPLLSRNPDIRFVIPEANRAFVSQRTGYPADFPIGLDDRAMRAIDGFTFYGIASAHNSVERDEQGHCKFLGYVVCFGSFSVYHSGDTVLYTGLEERLRQFDINVAFLPINGNDPSRGVAGNLNAAEAVSLARSVNIKCIIPHHYHMFRFNTADPEIFVREATERQQPYVVLRLGEHHRFS